MRNLRGLARHSLLLMALATLLFGCSREFTPEESVARAKEMMARYEYRPAFIELSNAAQKAPNLMEARWLLAKVALSLEDGARAEKEIRKAIELGQTRQATQPLLAKAILLQGDLERMLKETASMPEDMSNQNKAAVLGMRGQALLVQGKPDLAKPVLEEALRLEPNALEALIGMTAYHGYRREFDVARRWCMQGIKAQPSAPEVWSALGDLETAQGQTAKAEEAYGNAIQRRGIAGLDTVKRALARIELRKFNEAEQDIAALRKLGLDKHPMVSHAAGRLYFTQKKYPQAAEAFELTLATAPEHRLNNLYLAITYHLLDQQEKALALANRLAVEAPRSQTVAQLLGSIQMSKEDYSAAQTTLTGSLAKNPNNPGVLNMLSKLAIMQGDQTKALEYATRLASLLPDSREAQNQLITARLIAGQPISAASRGIKDAYTAEFLLALEAFRNGRLAEALEQANKLIARYPDKAEPIKLRAATYLVSAQWDKARPELEKVLKLQPNDPSAVQSLAKVEALQGNPKRAREILLPYVKAKPEDEAAALLLADVEARLGNTAAIPPLLTQTLQRNPGASGARARLAVEYLRTGHYQDVIALTQGFTDAQYQRQPALLETRGKALSQSGDTFGARKVFEQWVRLTPNSAPAHFYQGDMLARAGDAAGARKSLDRALKLDPRFLPARIGEIKLMVHASQVETARRALARLKQDFGAQAQVMDLEGWFALGTGDYPHAEKSLIAALAKQPDSETAILLARAQLAQNKTDAALQTLRERLQAQPRDLAVLMQLAGLSLGLNRNEEARSLYARVVESFPNHVPALNNLAWLSQDRDLTQAIQYARQAETLAPRDPFVKDTLGMLTLKQGNPAAALRLLEEAAKAAPGDLQIQTHYGQVLARLGRTTEARKILQAVLSKSPPATLAREARMQLDTLAR